MKFFEKKETEQEEFIKKYSNAFNAAIGDVDNSAKATIKENYCLNKIYDLFLDFIIDSKQLLKK
jgi:hypothetical protein